MLSVGIDNLPVTGPERLRTTADSMTMKRVGISQEWVSAEKRALRQAAAQAQGGASRSAGKLRWRKRGCRRRWRTWMPTTPARA